MSGELCKTIVNDNIKVPQISIQPPIRLQPSISVSIFNPPVFSQGMFSVPKFGVQKSAPDFKIIDFLSENLGAKAKISDRDLNNNKTLTDKLLSDFLERYDKELISGLSQGMTKIDQQKNLIISWLEEQKNITFPLFVIDDFDIVKASISEKNIDFVSKTIKYLKSNKDIKDEDKYNIALAVINTSSKNADLIGKIQEVLDNSNLSNSNKAKFILALQHNNNYSLNDLNVDTKVNRVINWIEKTIENTNSIIGIKEIKDAEQSLSENNIDFILQIVKKMNDYVIGTKKYNKERYNKEELCSKNEDLMINAVNIIVAAIKISCETDIYNSLIEKVIAHRFLPDETKARFIAAIPNNLDFANDLISADKLEYKIDDKYIANILEKVTDKNININIICKILENKSVNQSFIPNLIDEITNDNVQYLSEVLNFDIPDCCKPNILSVINKNTIKIVRKILAIKDLSIQEKFPIITSINNDNYKLIDSLTDEDSIHDKALQNIIPFISKDNVKYLKTIIEDPNIPDENKGRFLKNINNHNFDIAIDVIHDLTINSIYKDEIIANITKNNKKYAREIIWHKNINSDDIKYILELTNDETIDIVRKVINHPDIPSPNKEEILLSLLDNRENISKKLCNKILDSKKIEPCFKDQILSDLEIETVDLAEKIIDDNRINGFYKSELISGITLENKSWVEKLLKYDNFKFITAAMELCDVIEGELIGQFKEEILKYLENEYRKNLQERTNPYFDNYEGGEFVTDFDRIALQKTDKSVAEVPLENIELNPEDEINNASVYVERLKYYIEKFPNINISNLASIVMGCTSTEFANETGKNYTQKRSIVKYFSKNVSAENILKKTKVGDVIEQNKQLYINEGNNLYKWKMSREKFDELFPAGESLLVSQGDIGDCYLIITLIALLNNPLGKIYLYKSFEQENNDIICTIRAYKDYGGAKRFPKGQLPEVDTRLSGCKGLQMLEHTYAETALRYSDGVNHEQGNFLKNYARISGGLTSDCISELTGAEMTDILENDNFKHKIISVSSKSLSRNFLETYINAKNNCAFIEFGANNDEYEIFSDHSYELRKYDKANDSVILIDPHDSTEYIAIPYSDFMEINKDSKIYLCNLEELKNQESLKNKNIQVVIIPTDTQ